MAGGLRDVLAAQGVIPLSAAPFVATAGARSWNQLAGVWITGAPAVVIADEDKLADPYVGPSRFNEPFDRGYYLWKYGDEVLPKVAPGADPEPERPPIAETLLQDDLRRLEAKVNRSERDALELKLYIDGLTRELESDLLLCLADQQAERLRQQALIARLEENRVAARDALLLVLERQRRQRNQLMAVEASIRFFY